MKEDCRLCLYRGAACDRHAAWEAYKEARSFKRLSSTDLQFAEDMFTAGWNATKATD